VIGTKRIRYLIVWSKICIGEDEKKDEVVTGEDYLKLITIEFTNRVRNVEKKEQDWEWYEFVMKKLPVRAKSYISAKLEDLTESLWSNSEDFFEEMERFAEYSIWD